MDADKIEELVTRTRNGGAEVVALLKTGSAYYAPSAAAARMARAVIDDSGEIIPVCAWVDGEYGISGVYLGVEAEIGRERRQEDRRARPDRRRARRPQGGRRGGPRQAGRHRQPVVQSVCGADQAQCGHDVAFDESVGLVEAGLNHSLVRLQMSSTIVAWPVADSPLINSNAPSADPLRRMVISDSRKRSRRALICSRCASARWTYSR